MLRSSSMVEQLPVKELVVGSNPTCGAVEFCIWELVVGLKSQILKLNFYLLLDCFLSTYFCEGLTGLSFR